MNATTAVPGLRRAVAIAGSFSHAAGEQLGAGDGEPDGLGVGVTPGLGVPQPPVPLTTTESTRQPSCATELSEHILQRSFVLWPAPAAGRVTVVVWKPPAPAFDKPLQLGLVPPYCTAQGFWNPVLMLV